LHATASDLAIRSTLSSCPSARLRPQMRFRGALLASAFLLFSIACLAPPQIGPRATRPLRLGYLTSSAPDSAASADGYQQFRQRLLELGYRDGENLTIEYRYSDGKEERFPDLAAELVKLPVDVLVVGDSRAIPVARSATSTIPIVMTVSGDVVGQGLVTSLARPGGNLTGLTDLSRPLNGKRLELLRDVKPQALRVAVLWNGTLPGVRLAWGDMQAAAPSLGVDLISEEVQGPDDLDGALFDAARLQAAALCVLPDPLTNLRAQQIVSFAAQHRWPSIFGTKLFVNVGGLMSYGPDRAAMFRRAADYVQRIHHGADPGTLPIEQPSVFEFVVNLKSAESLGLVMPPSVLDQATELRN
jgi:putative tryptophan/tyrosine transport system substrate-binding protein